ncbi:MAG TPA: ABC transporter ATP-binding protein [Acidimicrobiales bacterium]|nr:ABC transporter ATP-binding protein [Acidimicrobiales bacterium]
MGSTAVDVRDVSKRFRLTKERYTSLKERVIHAGRVPHEDLWALKDVSFEIKEGETVGILGRNGSGKSTLLKCICGVLQPTSGEVEVRGTLAGLLELGAGFQQELSGRDNVYLNGSMLGLSKRDVDRVFDDIVAFAELEQFIDNQVKFYSSGMYVRLGFAVAVNVDPDVLVIDEVLAVGDERFQRKCMDRIKTFQEEGRTILFVTHSPDQVRSICDRAVVLNDGELIGIGPPGEAVRIFREHLLEAGDVLSGGTNHDDVVVTLSAEAELAGLAAEAEGRPVRLNEVRVFYPGMDEHPYLRCGDALHVRVGFTATTATEGVVFVLELRDNSGNVLVHTDTDILGRHFDVPTGTGEIEFRFATFPFLDGAYEVNAGIQSRLGGVMFDWQEQAARFEVMNPGRTTGVVELPVQVLMVEGALADAVAPSAAGGPGRP